MPTTLKEFESVFPKLVEDLTEHAKEHGIPSNALKWYQDVSSSSPLPPHHPIDTPELTTPSYSP